MWQRFTEGARKAVFYAQEEAQKFGEGFFSTEHLLLGLLRQDDSVAVQLLEKLGVSLNRIRFEVEKQLPRKGDARPSQDMTLSPRVKRVIDCAYEEAKSLNSNYIGTEHLLLGLVKEGDGLAGRVLAKLGLDLETLRKETMALQDSTDRGSDPAPAQPTPEQEAKKETNWLVRLSSSEAKKIFELAGREAMSVGLEELSGEHLLLGIFLEWDGKAAKVLDELGVTIEEVRKRLASN